MCIQSIRIDFGFATRIYFRMCSVFSVMKYLKIALKSTKNWLKKNKSSLKKSILYVCRIHMGDKM